MRRSLFLPLLLAALPAGASDSGVTGSRWQGRWGDGITDALSLSPLDSQQMKVHYWRKINPASQRAEPMSQGLGSTKQPLACNCRKAARRARICTRLGVTTAAPRR